MLLVFNTILSMFKINDIYIYIYIYIEYWPIRLLHKLSVLSIWYQVRVQGGGGPRGLPPPPRN